MLLESRQIEFACNLENVVQVIESGPFDLWFDVMCESSVSSRSP